MKPKKIDRSTKKWRELYVEMLKGLCIEHGLTKLAWDEAKTVDGYPCQMSRKVDAMPDRIKEAEEYADRLYQSLR